MSVPSRAAAADNPLFELGQDQLNRGRDRARRIIDRYASLSSEYDLSVDEDVRVAARDLIGDLCALVADLDGQALDHDDDQDEVERAARLVGSALGDFMSARQMAVTGEENVRRGDLMRAEDAMTEAFNRRAQAW